MTLKEFIYRGLEIKYEAGEESKRLLHQDEHIKVYFAKELWSSNKEINPAKQYQDLKFKNV